ncbi:rhodanese-related sulfurtransferase [Paenibacillus sp. LMG 31456]|uniref:Rhodanese-related sulfurtransferase n=1 Tax=Paenibacillus foliorum TaxID=2654974 RepID=A0A972GUQ2_9BACL|nr:immunity 53 family protein [Paenibacillus foliorum]NOU93165.1 rhodanese-related sulfurtransferase [Paenibacillus foliorum]
MNVLKWLEHWYSEYCDGDWEHSYGIKITTLDNPGWAIDIRLEGTLLENKDFQILNIERTDVDWIYCNVSENLFKGRGGSRNLEEILLVFQEWSNLCEPIVDC